MKKYTETEKQILKNVFKKYCRDNNYAKKDCIEALIKQGVIKDRRVFHNWFYPKYFTNPKNSFNPFTGAAKTEYSYNWLNDYLKELGVDKSLKLRCSNSTVRLYYIKRLWNPATKKKVNFSASLFTITAIKKDSDEFSLKLTPPFNELFEDHRYFIPADGNKEPNFIDVDIDEFKSIVDVNEINKLIRRAENVVEKKKKNISKLAKKLRKEDRKSKKQNKVKKTQKQKSKRNKMA